MSNALIRAGLESVLATWAAAQSPSIPVAWQNVTFPPPATRYLRAFLLPGDTESQDLAGVHREYLGVFQVSIVMPSGAGSAPGEAIAAALAALYPIATPITSGGLTVWIARPLSAAPPIQEADRYVIPCSLGYRAHTI